MSNNNLHIIDNGLKSKMGHHFNYDKAIVRTAARRDLEVTVWGHNSLDDADILAIAKPHFRHYLYSATLPTDFESAVAMHAADINVVIESTNSNDPIFIPNLLNVEIVALRQLLTEKKILNPLNLVVRYRQNTDGSSDSISFLNTLRDVCTIHEKTTVFADTCALVDILKSNGVNAKSINFPIDIPYSELIFDDRYDFAYVGQAASHKGFFHIVNALYMGAQIGYLPRVAIQTTGINLKTFDNLKERLPNVEWISSDLDTCSYYQLIANSGIIFAFYDPSMYTVNSSNILIEALSLNRCVLTSSFQHAAELLGDDLAKFSTIEYSHTALLHKMLQMEAVSCLPKSFIKRTDHARNLANTNLLIDLVSNGD